MMLPIILSCVIAIQGAALNSTEEREVTINGVDYVKEVLKSNVDHPWSLAIDSTNTLYFSNIVNDELKIAKIELDNNTFTELDIVDGFTQTVDRTENVTYLGTSNGIFKYDKATNEATVVLPQIDVWEVYFNKILYYSDFPSRQLYTFIDGVSERYPELNYTDVYHFCIDGDGDILFTNVTGLHSRNVSGDTVKYEGIETGADVRTIVTDAEGQAFVCIEDGIYKVDKSKTALVKVLDVSAYGVVFDAQNRIIYSNATSIVYLKPKSDECCVY